MNETDARAEIAGINAQQDAKDTALSIIADLFHAGVRVDRVFLREAEFYGECGYIVIGASVGAVEGTITVADTEGCHLELEVSQDRGAYVETRLNLRDHLGTFRAYEFALNVKNLLHGLDSLL